MSKKLNISLISFDNWNYDKEIVAALKAQNCNATHINIGNYKYKSFNDWFKNFISKTFFSKNLKIKYRQDYILETLEKIGSQDHILVLNPDLIQTECHLEIKKHTKRYIAYLYDSIARSKKPIEHLLNGIFDEIYSFDNDDCAKYGFIKMSNYIYLPESKLITNLEKRYEVITISSFDKRFESIYEIAHQLKNYKIKFQFILIGKNISYKVLKFRINYWIKHKKRIIIENDIKFQSKKIGLDGLIAQYNNGNIILDLVQGKQTGLSFRVFEAMALKKKIITDNKAIKEYSFFNPANILVIENNKINLDPNFFNLPYQEIDNNIYEEYRIDSWVKKVFNI